MTIRRKYDAFHGRLVTYEVKEVVSSRCVADTHSSVPTTSSNEPGVGREAHGTHRRLVTFDYMKEEEVSDLLVR